MSFFQTEKGKIITGVLAAVLATTAIMVPVSIFSDRAVRGDVDSAQTEGIHTYSYTSETGTTSNGFKIAGIGFGGNADTVQYLNKTNPYYSDVLLDDEMTDGVISTQGLGFGNEGIIGKTWLGDPTDSSYKPTAIALDVYEDDGTTIADTSNAQTALSMNLKISQEAANAVRGHMIGAGDATPLSISDFDASEYTDIISKDPKQFELAFGLFNYATYSSSAHDALDEADYNVGSLSATQVDDATFLDWFNTTFDSEEWGALGEDGVETLYIDGSSTAIPAVEIVLSTAAKTAGFDLKYELANSGSANSWGVDKLEDIPLHGGTSDASSKNSIYTFIGTSSSLQTDEMLLSKWGYKDEGLLATTYVNTDGEIVAEGAPGAFKTADAEGSLEPDNVIETTIAIDKAPTFFTSADLKVTTYDSVEGEDGKYHILTEEKTPTGITRDGIYNAYVNGVSWESLALSGDLIFS